MRGRGKIHVGTSGWHYEHWYGAFYPDDLPKESLLSYYAKHFKTVEINNSFYRLPEKKTLEAWRETIPTGFVFTVKGSRYITHMKKLKGAEEALCNFLERIDVLGETLGPVLFQLPPRWKFNPRRLENFLGRLPAQGRFAFEFRDPSWHDPAACELLKNNNAAFCIYDFAGRQSPRDVTADFVYVRLHGPGGAYRGTYGSSALSAWAAAFSAWAAQGKDVFCYFDNDEAGYAVKNALSLQAMVSR